MKTKERKSGAFTNCRATSGVALVGILLLSMQSMHAQQPVSGRSNQSGVPAVRGEHTSTGAPAGLFFVSNPSTESDALQAFMTGRGRAGFFRISNPANRNAALWGEAPTLGLFGRATANTGFTYGGRFESVSSSGRGVLGLVTAPSGQTIGVFGRSDSNQGIGVYGLATATSGTTYGVYGESRSAAGYAGYFRGRGYFEGNVGIGIPNPAAKLHVAGSTLITGNTAIGGALSVSGAATLTGNVGIGGAPGGEKLLVAGTARITGATTLGNTLSVAGTTTLNRW